MIVVEGTARIPAGKWPTARAAMEPMIRASRAEDGCIDYAYSVDMLDPDRLRVIELWRNIDALKQHFETPHMATFRKALTAIGPQDLQVRMFDAPPQALPL